MPDSLTGRREVSRRIEERRSLARYTSLIDELRMQARTKACSYLPAHDPKLLIEWKAADAICELIGVSHD